MTHFYQESGPSPDRLEESKKRIPMICNSFGWSGTCLCKDSRTLLAEGLVLVRGGMEIGVDREPSRVKNAHCPGARTPISF